MTRSNRQGATILIGSVVLVLLVVAVIGFARQVQASRVAAGAQGAVVGALALDAAQSALEEAHAALGREVNTAGTALFEALRAERPAAAREVVIAVPALAAELQRDPLTAELAVQGKGVTVRVLGIVAIADTTYDRAVTLELGVAVKHRSTGIVRRVVRTEVARVALLTLPLPFDQFSYLALDAAPLVDANTNAELTQTAEAMTRLRERTAPEVRAAARDLLERVNKGLGKREYDADSLTAAFAPDKHPAPPRFSTSVRDEHHLMAAPLSLFSRESNVDVAKALQAPEFRRRADRAIAARKAFDAALSAHEAALEKVKQVSDAQDWANVIPAFNAWKQALADLGNAATLVSEAHADLLAYHHDYTQGWGELAGNARQQLVSRVGALDVAAFAARAEHHFAGPDCLDRFEKFLTRHAAAPLNATVHLETSRTLDLAKILKGRELRGRLVISTTGPAVLADVSVKDPASDMLTLCAAGEITLAGNVHAALVAHGAVKTASDVTLFGALIQTAVTTTALRLKIVSEGRYHTAATGRFHPAFAHVALAPWAASTAVERE